MIDEQWQRAESILAVRLDNLGDVLLTTPAIHAIKASLPDAQITLLTSPVGAQAGNLNPDIADVIVYEAPWVDPWSQLPHDLDREGSVLATIRSRAFDAAVIFTSFRQSSLPAAYLCYLAGIPLRLGASTDAAGSLLTTRHRHPDRMMHEVGRALNLVEAVGFGPSGVDLVLQIPAQISERIASWLGERASERRTGHSGPCIVVHPGCSMPARTAPPEQFAEICECL